MCDGGVVSVPLIMTALSVGTAVYARNEQNKATAEMLAVQQGEIDDSAQAATNERMEEARALRASARAAAAEAAVGGNSVDAIQADIMGQAGRDISMIETNRKNGVMASAAAAGARTRATNAEAFATIGGSIANGVSSGYDNYKIKKNGGGGG